MPKAAYVLLESMHSKVNVVEGRLMREGSSIPEAAYVLLESMHSKVRVVEEKRHEGRKLYTEGVILLGSKLRLVEGSVMRKEALDLRHGRPIESAHCFMHVHRASRPTPRPPS